VCVLEGAARKWLVPGSGALVQGIFYLSKDGVLLLAALAAMHEVARTRQVRQLVQVWLLASLLVILASLVTISEVRPVGAVLTLRAMIVIPGLALIIAPGLRSQRDIDLVVNTIGLMALIAGAIGVVQFNLPATHFLNRLPDQDVYSIVDHGRVRATGTFSYISGMARMAQCATWAGCYLLLAPPRRWRGYVFVLAALACAAAGMSRSGLFISLAIMVMSLCLSIRGLVAALVLMVMVGGVALAIPEPEETEEQQQVGLMNGTLMRHRDGDSVEERSTYLFRHILMGMTERPLGSGLGTGQFGDAAFSEGSRLITAHEGELGRVIWEIGVLGFLAVGLLRAGVVVTVLASLFRRDRAVPGLYYLRWAALPAVSLLFLTNLVFDHVANTFTWVIVALTLATLEIDARYRPGGGSPRPFRQRPASPLPEPAP
jgi:hypothetical protein